MLIETALPYDNLEAVPDAARRIEALGFDAAVVPEINRDPFLPLLLAAEHTTRLGLATTVAVAFPRAPWVTAQLAWDLQRYSRGRFVLGLGTQVRKHNEERFSVPWSAPVARMLEYVQALHAIWDSWQHDTPPSFEGKHYRYTYTTPFLSQGPIEHPRIPVHLSAVNPGMCRLAGAVAAGVRLHGFCTRRYLDAVILPNVARGAAEAGRSLADLELSGGGFVATGPDEATVAAQLEALRRQIAFYGSTPTYRGVLDVHGWGDLGERLSALARRGRWEEMAGAVSDDVVRTFAAVGRYDEIVPRMRERFRGIGRLTFPLPSGAPRDEERVRAVLAALREADREAGGAG